MSNAFLGDSNEPEPDYNERIIKLIQARMKIGKERYGHGLRVNDDTRQWGTREDSWTEMGLEEVLDLLVYLSAQIIRIQEREANGEQVVHRWYVDEPVKRVGFIERMRRRFRR